MSQHSLNTDVNIALAALGSTMKGPAAPPAPLAGMLWLDDNTTSWVLKIFDGADWIPLGLVDPTTNAFIADGLAAGRFFAPKANDPADLKVKLEAGLVFDVTAQTLTAVASQQTATLTAPITNPRKDIVYIDRLTGTLGVATGTEAASPADPAIPAGKLPAARINWTAGATAITTAMIDDIRVLNALGLGALAVLNYVTDLPQNISLSGDITPPTITSDQNNYNPSGLASASTLRLTANGARAITGIAGGSDGRLLILHNIDTPKITLKNESASSTAGNRLALNSDITLAINQAALLQYDSVSERWRAVAVPCKDNSNIGQLQRSLRFNYDDNAYLSRIAGSPTSARAFTVSTWLKRSNLANDQNLISAGNNGANEYDAFLAFVGNSLKVFSFKNPSFDWQLITSALFRDPSAWYHVVTSVDTTLATAADRVKIYVNGTQVTSFSIATYPSQNSSFSYFNQPGVTHAIGAGWTTGTTSGPFGGYLADIHVVDGQQLTPSSFGELDAVTGAWMPKKYEGTYGNNGFHLDFSDNSGTTSATLGRDRSGNNNDWTPNNFSVSAGPGNDSLVEIPVNVDDGGNGKGNFCTLNPLAATTGFAVTFSNGNLDFAGGSGLNSGAVGTITMSNGKWYAEYLVATSNFACVGLQSLTGLAPTAQWGINLAASSGNTAAWGYRNSGNKVNNDNFGSSYGNSFTAGDLIGIAFDADSGKLWFAKNGAWQASGDPASGTNPAFTLSAGQVASGVTFALACDTTVTNGSFNFGQRPFSYTPPESFKALNTQNLPEPAIVKPAEQMNAALYTGNGSTQSISGVGFQPDLVWLKSRSNALDHKLTDAVRGVAKGLESNTADAETTDTNGVTAFNSDGFALGSDATYNTSAATYVAWAWKTGTTPGFDIVSYTGDGNAGRTVSHGLGVVPSLVIVKNRTDGSTDWAVWHNALANTEALNLNTQAAKFAETTYWNSTTPSASVLTLGTNAAVNGSGKSYVAYLWAEAAGFSRFGAYVGNGSSDGPFVWCGFRPKFVLIKRVDGSGVETWNIYDTTRDPYNLTNHELYPNSSSAESIGGQSLDMISSGVKLRSSGSVVNTSGGTYIFAAFAESPFKYARAR